MSSFDDIFFKRLLQMRRKIRETGLENWPLKIKNHFINHNNSFHIRVELISYYYSAVYTNIKPIGNMEKKFFIAQPH